MSRSGYALAAGRDSVADWFGGSAFLGLDSLEQGAGERVADYGQFAGHLLTAGHDGSLPVPYSENTWVFGVLMVIFVFIAWIRAYHGKGLSLLLNTFVTNRPLAQTMSDDHLQMRRVSVFLYLVFALSASLFIYHAMAYFGARPSWLFAEGTGSPWSGFAAFVRIMAGVSLAYVLKSLLLKLTGFIFLVEAETSEYIFNTFLIVKLLGLALFPVTALLAFLSLPLDGVLVYTGITLAALSYLYRFIRGAAVGRTTIRFSSLHLILYLCTLEFLPLVVLIKVLIRED